MVTATLNLENANKSVDNLYLACSNEYAFCAMNQIKRVYAGVVQYHSPAAFRSNLPAGQPKNKTMCTKGKEPMLTEADASSDRLWEPTSAEANGNKAAGGQS